MARNGKADLCRAGSNEKWLTGNQQRTFTSNYKQFPNSVQCLKCSSDYMRFAVDGICQKCSQRSEHLMRERHRKAPTNGVGPRGLR